MQWKFPEDPTREVLVKAAKSGDADLLREVLQQMNSSERTSALQTKTICHSNQGHADIRYTFKPSPLIAQVTKA